MEEEDEEQVVVEADTSSDHARLLRNEGRQTQNEGTRLVHQLINQVEIHGVIVAVVLPDPMVEEPLIQELVPVHIVK